MTSLSTDYGSFIRNLSFGTLNKANISVDGGGNINLLRYNSGSDDENQFHMNNDRLLNADEGVVLIYDIVKQGWRCVAFQT